MIIPNMATAALALLVATSAAANQENVDDRQNANPSQSGEESAHGYENPTGVDPDPRMTEQEAENAYERADEQTEPEEEKTEQR